MTPQINVPCTIGAGTDLVFATFISTVQDAAELSAAHVTDAHTGYITELDKVGEAGTAPGARQHEAGVAYSTRLRPVSDLSRLTSEANREVVLIHSQWEAFDTTRPADDPGSYQHQATLEAIQQSNDPTHADYELANALMASRHRNALVGGWQPNWFRPLLLIDGVPKVYEGYHRGGFEANRAHKGDLSIGLPIPHCLSGEFNLGRIRKIEVHAQCAQYVPATARYQRYAVVWHAVFLAYRN